MTAATIAVSFGTLLGILSGYLGGWVDLVIQRALEVLASFPVLILALMVVTSLGRPHESGSNVLKLVWQMKSLEEFDVTLTYCFTPDSLGLRPDHTSPPRDVEAFAEFCGRMTRRYGDG